MIEVGDAVRMFHHTNVQALSLIGSCMKVKAVNYENDYIRVGFGRIDVVGKPEWFRKIVRY